MSSVYHSNEVMPVFFEGQGVGGFAQAQISMEAEDRQPLMFVLRVRMLNTNDDERCLVAAE